MVDLTSETEAGPLVLDLAGRLRMGDRVLPVAPATLPRGGTTGREAGAALHAERIGDLRTAAELSRFALSDVQWRETTLEAHERQAAVR